MDKPTFIEALETHCPFTIIMENGEEYYVPNKDFAAVAPGDGSQVIVFSA